MCAPYSAGGEVLSAWTPFSPTHAKPLACSTFISCLPPSSGGHYVVIKGFSSRSFSSEVALLRPVLMPCPESLPLHDIPQLAQVGLGDDIVGFELQCTQVVGLRFREFTIEVEDGAEVHESSRVLGEGRDTARQGSKVCVCMFLGSCVVKY